MNNKSHNSMNGKLHVYSASAGSGKTYTLTVNYISLLLREGYASHEGILAVTFTKKATAEMKGRVLGALWEIANCPDSSYLKSVQAQIPDVDSAELQKRAQDALTAIVHKYDFFRIETIDSFFQSVQRNLAHELGLAASIGVEINDKQVRSKAVDHVLASNDKDVADWLQKYIDNQMNEEKSTSNIANEIFTLSEQITKETYMLNREAINKELEDETLSSYQQTLRKMRDEATAEVEAKSEACLKVFQTCGGKPAFSYGNWIESYITKTAIALGEPSDTIVKDLNDHSLFLKSADRKKPNCVEAAETLAAALTSLVEAVAKNAPIINSCNITLNNLYPLKLINKVGEEVDAINKDNGRMLLAYTPFLFHKLVKGSDASFVFEKAGTQFHHIMIDEFQDTSNIQWKNFKTLLIENLAKDDDCMLVGDVKQSIYRWRNGDWKILSDIDDEFPNNSIDKQTLAKNFRSTENIVQFNNEFFPLFADRLDQDCDQPHIADLYKDVKQQTCGRPGGCVEVVFVEKKQSNKKKTAEAEAPKVEGEAAEVSEAEKASEAEKLLAQKIRELNDGGMPFKDMTILVRKNKEVEKVLEALAKLDPAIPILSDEAFLLHASSAVCLLVNAMHYILDPKDTSTLAYVARTYAKIKGEALNWTSVNAEALKRMLPAEFTERLLQLKAMPIYELSERLISIFSLTDDKKQSPYVFCFLDTVLDHLMTYEGDLRTFLRRWDDELHKKAIPASEVDGVRIMTVHKAKGLDAPTILIPYCDWDITSVSTGGPFGKTIMLWCETEDKGKPYSELPFVPVLMKKEMENSVYEKEFKKEQDDQRVENLNLLYVAFTRARNNLFVWAEKAEVKPGAKITTTNQLLAEVLKNKGYEDGYKKGEVTTEKKSKEASANPFEQTGEPVCVDLATSRTKAEFRQSNSALDFVSDEESEEQQHYIDQGKLLHYVFSRLQTAADADRAINDLRTQGLLSEKEERSIRALVDKRLASDHGKAWFRPGLRVHNECNILSRTADGSIETCRPDRVVTDPETNQTTVVDFKFAHRPEAGSEREYKYRQQVEHYKDCLRRLGHADVRGFLWYVYTDEVVEI